MLHSTSNIIYLVGPNGTGKTRHLRVIQQSEKALFVPNSRQPPRLPSEFRDDQSFEDARTGFENSPEQVALRILRESTAVRLKVFSILSRKLDRDMTMNVVERSAAYTVKSRLGERYKEMTIPTYSLQDESAGVRELLVLLTLLHSPLYMKLCIDEPEVSLHPEAQRFLKNEMEAVAQEMGKKLWVATHSPVFFSPESIEDLERALFFSSPDKKPLPPKLGDLQAGELERVSRSLWRLGSEKWMLAHAKSAVFCEGMYDKAILRKVLQKVGIDLPRRDTALIETGGHTDFFTVSLLCTAIDRPAFFIADLDALLSSPLIDHFDHTHTPDPVLEELNGVADSLVEFIRKQVRQPLGALVTSLRDAPPSVPGSSPCQAYLAELSKSPPKDKRDKKLVLELVSRFGKDLEQLTSGDTQKNVRLLSGAVEGSCQLLAKANVLVLSRGTIEAYYASWQGPTFDLSDETKRELFETEFTAIPAEDPEVTKNRCREIVEFLDKISRDDFDNRRFVRSEIERVLARTESILLEDSPDSAKTLTQNPRFANLKVSDFLDVNNLTREGAAWIVEGHSVKGFTPAFRFRLDTREGGVQNDKTIVFEDQPAQDSKPQG